MTKKDSSGERENKMKMTTFRMLEGKHEELRIAAIRDKTSVNEILNRLVDEYLASRKDKK